MKRYIKSMPEYKGDIIDKLDEDARPLIKHLIKLYCYPQDINHHKWIVDLDSFIQEIPTMKGTHKYPKEKDIFKGLWEISNKSRFSRLFKRVVSENEETDVEEEEMREITEKYLRWLANILAECGSVLPEEVEQYVKENLER